MPRPEGLPSKVVPPRELKWWFGAPKYSRNIQVLQIVIRSAQVIYPEPPSVAEAFFGIAHFKNSASHRVERSLGAKGSSIPRSPSSSDKSRDVLREIARDGNAGEVRMGLPRRSRYGSRRCSSC